MAKKQSKSGGNRKHGRNSDYCKLYKAVGLDDKNRKRRMRRHILRNPGDGQARTLYELQNFGSVEDIHVVRGGKTSPDTATRKGVRKSRRRHDRQAIEAHRERRNIRRHARRVAAEKAAEQARQEAKRTVVIAA